MKLSPVNMIEETNFHNAWWHALQYVIRHGTPLTFGTPDQSKHAMDSCQLIELTGHAIEQIKKHDIHPQYPFKAIKQYCDEYTRKFAAEQWCKPEMEQFDYLYMDRLAYYRTPGSYSVDQLRNMQMDLKLQCIREFAMNTTQAITWYAKEDGLTTQAKPCLQRIWLRWYPENLVDLHIDWRSRDLYNAWQANIIAIVEMMNTEVIRPAGCRLIRVIDYSDSLHIYNGDLKQATDVMIQLY